MARSTAFGQKQHCASGASLGLYFHVGIIRGIAMDRYAKSIFVTALISLLCSCGGGSGGSGNSAPTTANVQGEWSGSYSISGVASSTPITAVIESGGFGFFLDSSGVIYVLPVLNGSTTVTGTITAYAPLGYTFTDGHTQDQFNLTGTASDTSITGTFGGNGETGTFTLSKYTPFSGTPSIISGSYQGFYIGSGEAAVDITMNSNGTFSGNDGNGCTIAGTASLVGSANLIAVAVDSTGTSTTPGIVCAGTLTGLGFESSTDAFGLFGGAAGTYYYFGVSNANSAFVAEFKAP